MRMALIDSRKVKSFSQDVKCCSNRSIMKALREKDEIRSAPSFNNGRVVRKERATRLARSPSQQIGIAARAPARCIVAGASSLISINCTLGRCQRTAGAGRRRYYTRERAAPAAASIPGAAWYRRISRTTHTHTHTRTLVSDTPNGITTRRNKSRRKFEPIKVKNVS